MTKSKLFGPIVSWLTGGARDEIVDVIDRKLLIRILKGQRTMALDLKALQDSTAALQADIGGLDTSVKALIALHTDPSQQSAIDSVAAAVAATDNAVKALHDAVDAIVNPPPPPPQAAPQA